MDITGRTIGLRDSALLTGDYNAYRRQLSQKLLAIRRRLGRTTGKREKFQKKPPVTADNIRENVEYAALHLCAAERAWAHAMHIKSIKSEDTTGQPITGSNREHILTRLQKAVTHARELLVLLQERQASGSKDVDIVETRAYLGSLAGALEFERQSEGRKSEDEVAKKNRWHKCLQQYSVARIIYATLLQETKREVYKDFINNTIDPTIRYAAYQAKLPRTVSIPTVALKFYPQEESEIANIVKKIDPQAFTEQKPIIDRQVAAATHEAPTSITWRGRTASLVDASIGQALAQAAAAEASLQQFLRSNSEAPPSKRANAYDDILIAYQDAADANRRAIDELEKEGADEGDNRMQDLRVSSLAINYDLVSWRVGRNRVLIGEGDGRTLPDQVHRKPKRPRRDGKPWPDKMESRSQKLARLRERIVLYDTTIQSIESVKSLRGAVRDSGFVAELNAKISYFQALKCLNIALSHSMFSNHFNALALASRAAKLAAQAAASLPNAVTNSNAPPTLDIHASQSKSLHKQLQFQVQKHHALAEMHKFEQDAAVAAKKNKVINPPLVERINSFTSPGLDCDLTNLVSYPPSIEAIPIKPLFFDVAFNYLEYPGRAKTVVEQKVASVNGVADTAEKANEKKNRGWFGFGR